ncbi:MAG TPA: alpha/beta hydrolase [Rudaea sp.]|jgi:pimeloyl-ACP methyl ester carboxylesterase
MMRRILKWLTAILAVFILAAIVAWLRPAWTPEITTSPNAIASLEQVELNGSRQWILIRGRDRSKPLLLFLHGGPGMPAMYLAHASTRALETDFVVVHWDRRDAGKSFDPQMSAADEKVSQQLADAEALVIQLRRRFGSRPMLLLGHSWGTYLGTLMAQRHPEWFAAYVGMGQVTDTARERQVADKFIVEHAQRSGLTEAIKQMQAQPNAYREQWLFAFGAELHRATSFVPLLMTGLAAPEYTLRDAMNVARGPQYASRHMQYDVIAGSLAEAVKSLDLPVFLFAGRYDYVTPSELGVAYVESLHAPCKRVVWFENSAHFPFYEEPEQFARAIRDVSDTPCVAARLSGG